MHLFRLIPPLDYPATVGYFGVVLRIFGMLLAVPAGVTILAGDPPAAARLWMAVATAVGGGWWMGLRRPPELRLREALVVAALIYPAGSLLASAGFWGSGSALDSWFEAMSGLTTTGLSALEPLDLGYAERFLRSYLQWVGGAGIVVVAIVLLGQAGGSAFRLFAGERGAGGLRGNVASAARRVVAVYGGASAVLFAAYVVATRAFGESLLLTFSTISTGGFASSGDSPGAAGAGVLAVAFAGMVLGATAFSLLREPAALLRDWQARGFLVAAAAGVGIFWVAAGVGWHQVFDAVSAVTTTGFRTTDVPGWSDSQQFGAVALMVVGGMAGSTAGGVKIYRVIVAGRLVQAGLLRRVLPREAILHLRYEGDPVSDSEVRDIGVFLVAYVMAVVAGTLVLTLSGLELGHALFGSSSALGTVGLWSGAPIGTLPLVAKVALIGMMWAGRLELMAVLVVLYPGTWRRRGRRISES